MKHFKIILFGLLVIPFLSACGDEDGGSDTAVVYENAVFIEKPDYKILIPDTWREIFPSETSVSLPHTVESIFKSTEIHSGVIPNLIVTKENVGTGISSLEFSQKNKENMSASFYTFEITQEQEVEISGVKTLLIEFLAQKQPGDQQLKYTQTFLVIEENGYAFTVGFSPDSGTDFEKTVRNMILSIEI